MLNMSAVWDMKMFNKINGCCYYYCKLSIIKSTVMLKLQYFGNQCEEPTHWKRP